MIKLKSIDIKNIRNLYEFNIKFEKNHTWFIGDNGAGKTSLLEAIFILMTSKSFRSRSARDFISHGKDSSTLFGCIEDHTNKLKATKLGLSKTKRGDTSIRINSASGSVSQLLSHVPPVQVISNDLVNFIDGTSNDRRKILDWGVFHVKHQFLSIWRNYKRVLKQRNAALRQYPIDKNLLASLDNQFIPLAINIHQDRLEYWTNFLTFIKEKGYNDLLELIGGIQNTNVVVTSTYESGWNKHISLEEALFNSSFLSNKLKTTIIGPHRADISFKFNGVIAREALSRGQKRIFQCWLKLKQAEFLFETKQIETLFLLDDVTAEIDHERSIWLYQQIDAAGFQCVSTGNEIYPGIVENLGDNLNVFHVKHGKKRYLEEV